MPISTIEEAVEEIRSGKMVIVVDDEDRENEGDLVVERELELVETVPLEVEPNEHNRRYLETKQARMGHVLHLLERTPA